MEPKVSPFQTGFLTEAGNINTSKQYYAFIEKEGLACWIVAEQIDSSEEKESAKLAAEQIIWDFSQKPTLSQSKLREYLTNAHQKLVNESGNIMLKASLVMVVSDYSRMVWAVSGNVRLYHFRDKVFNFRSKDQTMAQVMLDAGNLKEEEINRRNERSGLINYLGISTEFKPLISRVFPLHEGDKILICNLGLWEKVTAQDLTQALEANEGPAQVLKQLQENWLIKSDKPLKQFIGTLIYVDKISGKKIINYLTPQNVATCLSVLAIVGAGWLVGNIFSQTGMEPKTEKPQTINGVKKQPTATNRLSKEHKQIDLHNKVRQTQNSETEIHDENINWPNQNQPVETKKAEKRREEEQRQLPTEGTRKTDASKAPRQRWQVDVAVHKEPDVQSLPQRQKGAATASGNLSEPQTRQNEESKKKRQQEVEVPRHRPKATTESFNKQPNTEEQQSRRNEGEDLKKQAEVEEQQHRQKRAEVVKKQEDEEEQQLRRKEIETLKKQQDTEEQQRKQKELEDIKKQQDAEEQQRRRKEAEAERRRKLKEAEAVRKQQEAEVKQQTRTPEGDRSQGSEPLAESSNGKPLTRDAKIAQAKTFEKNGDEKYNTEKYSAALDLYKKAQRAYVELGMAVDAARVDQKINITINKKLEYFLKRHLKK